MPYLLYFGRNYITVSSVRRGRFTLQCVKPSKACHTTPLPVALGTSWNLHSLQYFKSVVDVHIFPFVHNKTGPA